MSSSLKMPVNITSIKTPSSGIWEGDNPLNFAFPLLIVQTTLIIVVSRFFAFLFKPLRQPKVVAEIIGGIILGPSAFGRNQKYMQQIFPKWSTPILESVASVGLIFFLFLVGLELDLSSIRRSGRRAFSIAAAGVLLPFAFGVGVAFIFRKAVDGADKVGYVQYLVFMGVAMSITAFPVLARILAELKLLTTRVGETAMAAAAFNDVAAWILLALAIALAGDGADGPHKSPLISVWVLLTGAAFVVFMMVVIKPAMKCVTRRCSPEHDTVDEAYICLTLAGVMAAGFATDFIGIHAIFGAFVFGLTIPKEGHFAERLIERIEDFVSGLLLPLYFASSGLKTDVTKIHGAESWGLLLLVIATASTGKILGTFSAAILCKIPARESLTLGVLMNSKGLVELIVLNIGKEKKVLNDEAFAILVLMALLTTFITTPTVMVIYKPSRGYFPSHRTLQSVSESQNNKAQQLRILACVHGPANVPSVINLVESVRSTNVNSRLKLYVMHLVELTERSSSIVKLQRLQKNGLPFINRLWRRSELHDGVAMAFQAYGQLGRVSVRPATAVSALSTMHEDICHVAENKRAALITVPFHKQWRKTNLDGNEYQVENAGHGWRGVHQRVLKEAPCSVAVLVDRGFDSESLKTPPPTPKEAQRVCVLFIGGPDDREALELGGRMAEHPAVKVTVIRFLPKCEGMDTATVAEATKEKELDEGALMGLQRQWKGLVEYKEKATSNIAEEAMGIGRSGAFELIIVGKGNGQCPSTVVGEAADGQAEHSELGPIGDLLASSEQGLACSALVLKQHVVAHSDEVHISKTPHSEEIHKNAAHVV